MDNDEIYEKIYDAATFNAAIDDYLEKHPEYKVVGPKRDHGAEMTRWISQDRAKPKQLCIDCHKTISQAAIRCASCANTVSAPKKARQTVINRKFVA